MSELINHDINRDNIRWKLLAGASALVLVSYISTVAVAKAENSDRPSVWIELGSGTEFMQGISRPFTAPFMSITPTPGPYQQDSLTDTQKPPRMAFGGEAKLTFEPNGTDWSFSASIRYGRSNLSRRVHHQTLTPRAEFTFYFPYYHRSSQITRQFPQDAFANTDVRFDESHAILDFQAGRDVGLGLFGSNGTSTISAGVRFAQFQTHEKLNIYARPEVKADAVYHTLFYGYISIPYLYPNFHIYGLEATATRSFRGIGPSISWNASAALVGNEQNGELTFDWGLSGALLFGKQKSKIEHATQGYHYFATQGEDGQAHLHYDKTLNTGDASARVRSAAIPNLGGFAGMSWRSPHTKVSLGYRVDAFFGAMDTGIGARKTSDLIFHGPYASLSIGLGG